MHALANEIGYSNDEINAIDDGRSLIVLSLANHAARLIKAGIMDGYGNIVNVPQLQTTPVDPRLAAPDPQRTLGGTGARSTRGSATIEQQLSDMANMSDEEFNKLPPEVIEAVLKAA
jgi:hypothetical protein